MRGIIRAAACVWLGYAGIVSAQDLGPNGSKDSRSGGLSRGVSSRDGAEAAPAGDASGTAGQTFAHRASVTQGSTVTSGGWVGSSAETLGEALAAGAAQTVASVHNLASAVTTTVTSAVTTPKAANAPGAPAGHAKTVSVSSGGSHPDVVVELYTSQGCSTCPPADEFLSQLVGRHNVIPLALHVDYWDYIGWTDQFGSAQYTRRQKAYARAAGSRTIYTPQIIVEGEDRVEGARPMDVAELIQQHRSEVSPVTLTVSKTGEAVEISAQSTQAFAQPLNVQIVRYLPEKTVKILRGENAGQQITYRNIVTDWQTLGTWDGAAPLSAQAVAKGDEPVVVILQKPGPGEIVAATRLK